MGVITDNTQNRPLRVFRYTGMVPTIPPTEYRSDGTWIVTDLTNGQLAVNIVDKKMWYRANTEIIELNNSLTEEQINIMIDNKIDNLHILSEEEINILIQNEIDSQHLITEEEMEDMLQKLRFLYLRKPKPYTTTHNCKCVSKDFRWKSGEMEALRNTLDVFMRYENVKITGSFDNLISDYRDGRFDWYKQFIDLG